MLLKVLMFAGVFVLTLRLDLSAAAEKQHRVLRPSLRSRPIVSTLVICVGFTSPSACSRRSAQLLLRDEGAETWLIGLTLRSSRCR
ncbi:MAG: hypothetical protein U0W40_13550 [Acidimicrobiia bacterium]